ncbi:MAG TPA: lycopene beta-cyclase CrtY [Polyangia bacterium]|nr:lycopene beta-cyclase CrtY [Polyangia bacterium]
MLATADLRGPEEARAGHVVVIVGGGLAGGLLALALAEAGRGAGVVLVERDAQLGGNHTWSFHETDLDAAGHALLAPLVTRRWSSQRVRFPGFERALEAGYGCVTAETFRDVLSTRLERAGVRVLLGRDVTALGLHEARLDDGAVLIGDVVLDARGPAVDAGSARSGFQKFVGLELELLTDGPWTQPVLMDATVPQLDGYRFTYVLPFSSRRVLIEDTTYSEGSLLDVAAIERRVLAYVEAQGATVSRVLRREVGVLPLPLRAAPAPDPDEAGAIAVGYRGGFFHPVTGYSLPLAVRVALAVARARGRAQTMEALRVISGQLRPQRRFGVLLNRLMFDAMPPASRWTALERFYRLPSATIARFYASRSTLWDRARVLLGQPPRGVTWRGLVGAVRGGT